MLGFPGPPSWTRWMVIMGSGNQKGNCFPYDNKTQYLQGLALEWDLLMGRVAGPVISHPSATLFLPSLETPACWPARVLLACQGTATLLTSFFFPFLKNLLTQNKISFCLITVLLIFTHVQIHVPTATEQFHHPRKSSCCPFVFKYFSHSYPLATTNLFSFTIILPFPECHINRIT